MSDILRRAAGCFAVVLVPFTYLASVADDQLGCDLLSDDDD